MGALPSEGPSPDALLAPRSPPAAERAERASLAGRSWSAQSPCAFRARRETSRHARRAGRPAARERTTTTTCAAFARLPGRPSPHEGRHRGDIVW